MKLPDNFNIAYYATKYPDNEKKKDKCIKQRVPDVKKRGYLTKRDLKKVSIWKSKYRNVHHIEANSDDCIMEITRTALTPDTPEHDRINGLRCLRGVDWATASAILHWFHQDLYPIWDRPASEAIEFEKSQYKNDFERWDVYMSFCRNVAAQKGVDMRTLDRALWQYSDSKKT